MLAKNADRVEDNAVTVMSFPSGAIAVNETGFVNEYSPVAFEVWGEDGYIKMNGSEVVKLTRATGGVEVKVDCLPSLTEPLDLFMQGKPAPGCDIDCACALTKMMEAAYRK